MIDYKEGFIFNIQKFSIHDGSGIRTMIFMKGCPLKCSWCSNPESQSYEKEIMFVKKNCMGCGKCVDACPKGIVNPKTFLFERATCDSCGSCTLKCYAQAKKIVGKKVSVDTLIEEIEKDMIFYRNSKGGVTVGGGEPTGQPEFVTELLKGCKELGIHTAIETCGFASWTAIRPMFDYLDQVFYDLKHMDDQKHKSLTNVSNHIILENAKNIAALGKDITFRVPLVAGCNDDEKNMIATADFVLSLMQISDKIKIEILPYHNLGADKYTWLDTSYALKALKSMETGGKERFQAILKKKGCFVI